eukprot:CAMPEP_0181335448 /NCGR_PEP_ID=MMETSP1101-20121128/26837_1 /TAXON_ID=46948 /ORGANISM="Rhodomonas abbreviata, Strain Caron Lab Isolate" /LENGTH=1401 /DNA_ID=CAMNT_0023445569 /DNA_START=43 /DNA_END=4248 /DNA_ORIENTATION=+
MNQSVQYLSKLTLQIKLLLWKRLQESTKSNWELLNVFLPAWTFFAMMLLMYSAFKFLAAGGIEPFLVPMSFWIFVQRIVVQVMTEKESRLQESMRMMGLSDVAYYTGYFLSDGVILGFILSFSCAIISAAGLFNDGDFGSVFGLLFTFCLSSVPFAFFIAAFFDTPQTSGQATLGLLVGFYVISITMFTATGNLTIPYQQAQVVCCLFPPLALQIGSGAFLKSYDGISIGSICSIMVADMFIYSLLAWYFAQVWPSKVGVAKPWYFVFQPSYWLPLASRSEQNCQLLPSCKVGVSSDGDDEIELGISHVTCDIPSEAVNEGLMGKPTVHVNKLRKTYGSTVVVNDLSFDMYENQIFALLGHNGAGKTTTISMLTGLISPDSHLLLSGGELGGGSAAAAAGGGSASIYGSSILSEMDQVRRSMGVCPQHDVLFEKLSVREHVLFFAQLKGASYAQANAEATQLLSQFHLQERLDHLGHELSGGQRRKLSVAIAVCGGSKFVLLDEPTAGMDPLARRELWDLLASLRKGRTMLLTTHYMDEADVLGDRVGIMSLGQMQCFGSTRFLKNHYGAGYKLIFDKLPSMKSDELAALTAFVQSFIPDAKYFEEDGAEEQAQYSLPFATVGQFGALFSKLDEAGVLSSLHTSNYGAAITSLEDVFLKVGGDHSVEPTLDAINGIGASRKYESNLMSQISGIMMRKLTFAGNDFVTIPLVGIPIAAILAAGVLDNMEIISKDALVATMVTAYIYMGGYLGAPGLIAEFIVKERVDKLRNVLTVMGCDFRAYWIGTFLADFLIMSVPTLVMWISWGALGMSDFYSGRGTLRDALPGMAFAGSTVFIIQLVSFSYFFSSLFTSPKACISYFPILMLMLLIGPQVVISIVQEIFNAAGNQLSETTQQHMWFWGMLLFSPQGALFISLAASTRDYSSMVTTIPSVWSCLTVMLLESAGYMLATYYMDVWAVAAVEPVPPAEEGECSILDRLDDDVLAERRSTAAKKLQQQQQKGQEQAGGDGQGEEHPDSGVSAKAEPDVDCEVGGGVSKVHSFDQNFTAAASPVSSTAILPLLVDRLLKTFPAKVAGRPDVKAVRDVSFNVESGEIFGLLGANGAGKTTVLSMLTRHVLPTSGDAFVTGESILQNFTAASTHLGVVTQNNSLWDRLSVEDHLFLFARLRGVPEDLVSRVVEGTIDQLELTPHRHKLSMRLSGGMKRKLCVAIALIGDPEVVLLDEPSAGLDPVSRRNLWSVILRTMSHRAVILTTHSMDEAEALCKRIGIMVHGQLHALGTKQHLKNKFGSGFELVVKLSIGSSSSSSSADVQSAVATLIASTSEFVCGMFPSAVLLSENGGLLTYTIPREEMKMGLVFTQLEKSKQALSIEDYAVAQPTLEQVFIRTVNEHTEEGHEESSKR